MILLKTLLESAKIPYVYDGPNPRVRDIAYDSRLVLPGTLFIAVKGFESDGHDYIREAFSRGAAGVVAERMCECEQPLILVKDSRSALAMISYAFYDCHDLPFPLVGVTGTNGKTTITHLLYQLASAAGKNPALMGTLGVINANRSFESDRTTPESRDIAFFLDAFRRNACGAAFMEVSSHAIALKRVLSLTYDAAVFTNLTRDHLDFHKDMEHYFISKSHLFTQLRPDAYSIINIDDLYGKRLFSEMGTVAVSYSLFDKTADVHYRNVNITIKGIHGILQTPAGVIEIRAEMPGMFNAENIAAALAVWIHLFPYGSLDLNNFPFRPVPGRMEMIHTARGTAVIDYAHTPDAMEKVLKAASELDGRKRMITVFGCGGNRDREKRPMMGQVAEKYSDVIIITNDNPRFEEPLDIAHAIAEGIRDKDRMSICIDRKEAIRQAYEISEPGDLLMILGKGAETYMEIAGKRRPLNDKEIILKLEKHK